jgi:hypothetical protein
VADENDSHPQSFLKAGQQIEDLRLDRHIESRGRFVCEQYVRVTGQCHGDHRPLPHAAGELVRVVVQPPLRVGDRHQAQHLRRPLTRRGPADAAVQPHRFRDLIADRPYRVQAGHRLLEDHRDLVPPDAPHLHLGDPHQIPVTRPNRGPRLDPAGRVDEPQDRQAGDRLAAARLADYP